MRQTAERQEPAGYRLRVKGHLDQHWSAWFDDFTLTRDSGGTTSLSGAVTDQAELHGLLTKIRDLGITLISVDVIDPPAKQPPSDRGGAQTRGVEPAECAPPS